MGLAFFCHHFPRCELHLAHNYPNLIETRCRAKQTPALCSVGPNTIYTLIIDGIWELWHKFTLFFWSQLFLPEQHSTVSLYWPCLFSKCSSLPNPYLLSVPSNALMDHGPPRASPDDTQGYFPMCASQNQPGKIPTAFHGQWDWRFKIWDNL